MRDSPATAAVACERGLPGHEASAALALALGITLDVDGDVSSAKAGVIYVFKSAVTTNLYPFARVTGQVVESEMNNSFTQFHIVIKRYKARRHCC